MIGKRSAAVALGAAAALVLVGCVQEAQPSGPDIAVADSPSNDTMFSIVAGTVIIDDNGCVALDDEISGERNPVIVFPYGTTVDASSEAILIPAWGTLNIGESIDTEGGLAERATVGEAFAENFPPACLSDLYVVPNFLGQ